LIARFGRRTFESGAKSCIAVTGSSATKGVSIPRGGCCWSAKVSSCRLRVCALDRGENTSARKHALRLRGAHQSAPIVVS
jgi:hypothetical protein